MSPRRLVLTLHSLYCCRREGRRGEDGQATVEGARVRGWVKNTAGRCGFRVKTRAESAVGWDAHLGLGGGDPVHDEAALRVVDEAEVLVGLVDGNDVCGREGGGVYGQPSGPSLFLSANDAMERRFAVLTHEAGGVALVDTSLAVNLDEALHEDGGHLLVGERVLQAVAQDEAQGKALAGLVGTGGGLGGEDAAQLVKHPVLGGIEPLEVLLGSARHCDGLEEGFVKVSDASVALMRSRIAHLGGSTRRGIPSFFLKALTMRKSA